MSSEPVGCLGWLLKMFGITLPGDDAGDRTGSIPIILGLSATRDPAETSAGPLRKNDQRAKSRRTNMIGQPSDSAGELKNGLQMDRLSSHRFLANGQKMMTHVLAYLLYALFREANAETSELRKMEVGTARVRVFKVGALVKATHRRTWFKVASHWPGADLLTRAVTAVKQHVTELQEVWRGLNLLSDKARDRRNRARIQFAPFLLK